MFIIKNITPSVTPLLNSTQTHLFRCIRSNGTTACVFQASAGILCRLARLTSQPVRRRLRWCEISSQNGHTFTYGSFAQWLRSSSSSS